MKHTSQLNYDYCPPNHNYHYYQLTVLQALLCGISLHSLDTKCFVDVLCFYVFLVLDSTSINQLCVVYKCINKICVCLVCFNLTMKHLQIFFLGNPVPILGLYTLQGSKNSIEKKYGYMVTTIFYQSTVCLHSRLELAKQIYI